MFKIKDLSISYKKNTIININNYFFEKNGLYCIVGMNGSGKTTLCKALMNLIDYKGIITYNDINIKDYSSDLYKKVCYVDQFGNYIDFLGTTDNLSITNQILNENIDYKLKKKKITKMSGGERKKFELSRLDYSLYEAFILDEPTTSLDKYNKNKFIEKVKNLSKDKLVIIVTHDVDIIENCSNKLEIDNINCLEDDIKENEYVPNEGNIKLPKKIIFSNLFKNIVCTVLFSIFLFSIIIYNIFHNYNQNEYSRQIVDRIGYYKISNEYRNDFLNDIMDENHEIQRNKMVTGIIEGKTVYSDNYVPFIPYYNFDSDKIVISDSLASKINDSKNLTISFDEFTTTVSVDEIKKTDYDIIPNKGGNINFDYIVLPSTYVKYDTSLQYDENNNHTINYIIDATTNIPNRYIISYGPCISITDTSNIALVFFVVGLISIIICIYLNNSINFINKSKLNYNTKLKSLGVRYNQMFILFICHEIIKFSIATIFSFFTIDFVSFINDKFLNADLEFQCLNFKYANYDYFSLLLIPVFGILYFSYNYNKFRKYR